jgi:hypothetical protein
MQPYKTLSEAVNDLTKKGYTYNFNIKSDCLECAENNMMLQPDEFDIDAVYRFEGMNDPGDSTILYAISSHHGLKGLLVNAYGMYDDAAASEIIRKLKVHH